MGPSNEKYSQATRLKRCPLLLLRLPFPLSFQPCFAVAVPIFRICTVTTTMKSAAAVLALAATASAFSTAPVQNRGTALNTVFED